MNTRVTEDFFKSFGKLTPSEQKRSQSTIFSIFHNDTNGGLRYHKIEHPSNKIFSYSVNMDIRVIVHATSENTTLLYIGHHDDAYSWVSNRKFVDRPESITIIETFNQVESNPTPRIITERLSWDYEIDPDLRKTIYELKTDDEVIDFIISQPDEIQEQLLDIVRKKQYRGGGYRVTPDYKVATLTDDIELEKALQYPLDSWRIFLHPRQKEIVNKPIQQSGFITGCPGTGKTVCLVHMISRYSQMLSDDECIFFGTFKKGLASYITNMLTSINTRMSRVFIEDISAIKIIEKTPKNAGLDGFYQIISDRLYFYNHKKKLKVRHLFFDEYQDYKDNQCAVINQLSKYCPFTIAFDYSQSIYRRAKYTIQDYQPGTEVIILDYSYRVTAQILDKLKKILSIVRVFSLDYGAVHFSPLFGIEESVITNATAAISGQEIGLYSYNTKEDIERQLVDDYSELVSAYSTNEIVVTSFFSDLYKTSTNDSDYHSEVFPEAVRRSYHFAPSLKGKEFKAGIVILDESICQMLNINQLLLGGKVSTDFRGGSANYRRNINLLYVVLSRFRDYIKVYYPKKYELIISPLFK